MRIAFVVNSYPPRLGGLESHIYHLSVSLAQLGHEVVVLTIADEPGRRTEENVDIRTDRRYFPVADIISFPALGATRSIARFLRERRIDVVSVHTRFFPMSFVGVRAAHQAGIPVIHTEHGSGFVASSSPIIAPASRMVDLTMGRYVLRHADRVLGVSEQAAAFASRLGGVSADVFYNAITPPAPHDEPIEDRPRHLVFVGRMVPGKGWDTFIEAVAQLRAEGQEVTGELLGTGADLEAARSLITERGLGEYVSAPGRVSADEVRARLAGATLVNPTVLSEGFQTTLLEVLAERGRVVTFTVPGAKVLAEQGNPVVITPDRTVESLVATLYDFLNNPPTLGDPALIDAWTWPVRAREYASIAESLLGGSTPHDPTHV